jgi:hypothetical protein
LGDALTRDKKGGRSLSPCGTNPGTAGLAD